MKAEVKEEVDAKAEVKVEVEAKAGREAELGEQKIKRKKKNSVKGEQRKPGKKC